MAYDDAEPLPTMFVETGLDIVDDLSAFGTPLTELSHDELLAVAAHAIVGFDDEYGSTHCVNEPIEPGMLELESMTAIPVFGSFWRWLFNRPSHFKVEYNLRRISDGEERTKET